MSVVITAGSGFRLLQKGGSLVSHPPRPCVYKYLVCAVKDQRRENLTSRSDN